MVAETQAQVVPLALQALAPDPLKIKRLLSPTPLVGLFYIPMLPNNLN